LTRPITAYMDDRLGWILGRIILRLLPPTRLAAGPVRAFEGAPADPTEARPSRRQGRAAPTIRLIGRMRGALFAA
jgi:hypothetical protein